MRLRIRVPVDSWLFKILSKDYKPMAAAVVPIVTETLPVVIPIIQSIIAHIKASHAPSPVTTPDLTSTVSQSVKPILDLLQKSGVITSVDSTALDTAIQTLIHLQQVSTPGNIQTVPDTPVTPAPTAPSVSGTIVNADGKTYSFTGSVTVTGQ